MNNIKDNSKMIKKFLDAENERDWNTWASFLHEEVEFEVIGNQRIITGKDAYIRHMQSVYSDLEDWHFEILSLLADEKKVVVEFYGQGQFSGEFEGKQYDHSPLKLKSVCIFELSEQKIRKCTEYFDYQSYRQQLSSKIYRGTVIEESLTDNCVLNDLKVVKLQITRSENPNNRWHIYTFEGTREEFLRFQKHLKHGAWYIHFWRDNQVTVIYPKRVFEFTHNDQKTWKPAVDHGLSLGIPIEQLDFLLS